jgi:YhcN/YlaJ family sporulation lipoprotein
LNILRSMIIAVFFISVIGCQQTNDAREGNNNAAQGEVNVQQTAEDNKQDLSRNQIAKRLVGLATSVPQVKDATAVVAGDYAVVGIDVDKDLDRSHVGTIKYSVAEALKDDPYGANAVIAADVDTVERLRQMGREIQAGKPVQGVLEELAKIVGRLIPQMPDEIANPDEQAPEQNKQQLPDEEERNLNQQQKKQGQESKQKKQTREGNQ